MRDASALARQFALWVVPLAIALAAIGIETDWGRSLSRDSPVPAAAAPQPVAVALLPEYTVAGGLDARRETVDRVLFNPTRRPAPPALQGSAAASAMKRGQYALTGTTVVGNVATAFLREVNGGKSRSVRTGDKLADGIVVADVKSDRVRLKQGDDVEELSLKIASGPKATVQVAPVAAAPGAVVPGVPAAGSAVNPAAAAAAAAAAGGSGRGARPPGAPPPPPGTAPPRSGGSVSVSELLAERRRAARAAAEAAAAGGGPTRTPAPPR